MPHPYGIVIHRNVVIGSRVTVMHQVTIGNQHPSDPGAPVIEDNVCIGAGAKILGAVRIGHGATVGANAVVTRDVPSHCTVVGANRILGAVAVAKERQQDEAIVVNT
jgi:serine O-acetyltransferase